MHTILATSQLIFSPKTKRLYLIRLKVELTDEETDVLSGKKKFKIVLHLLTVYIRPNLSTTELTDFSVQKNYYMNKTKNIYL